MKERKDLHWQGPHLFLRTKRIAAIVQDENYPLMWRVRRRDGSLSDMANITRARDAAMAMALRNLLGGKTGAEAVPSDLSHREAA